MKITRKIAEFPSSLKGAITMYLRLTQPLHHIKNQGIEVLSALLYEFHKTDYRKDEMTRWGEVFSYDTKVRIKEELGEMSDATFNNHLSALRKSGAILKPNRVAPSFNPLIQKDSEAFEIILRFKLNG